MTTNLKPDRMLTKGSVLVIGALAMVVMCSASGPPQEGKQPTWLPRRRSTLERPASVIGRPSSTVPNPSGSTNNRSTSTTSSSSGSTRTGPSGRPLNTGLSGRPSNTGLPGRPTDTGLSGRPPNTKLSGNQGAVKPGSSARSTTTEGRLTPAGPPSGPSSNTTGTSKSRDPSSHAFKSPTNTKNSIANSNRQTKSTMHSSTVSVTKPANGVTIIFEKIRGEPTQKTFRRTDVNGHKPVDIWRKEIFENLDDDVMESFILERHYRIVISPFDEFKFVTGDLPKTVLIREAKHLCVTIVFEPPNVKPIQGIFKVSELNGKTPRAIWCNEFGVDPDDYDALEPIKSFIVEGNKRLYFSTYEKFKLNVSSPPTFIIGVNDLTSIIYSYYDYDPTKNEFVRIENRKTGRIIFGENAVKLWKKEFKGTKYEHFENVDLQTFVYMKYEPQIATLILSNSMLFSGDETTQVNIHAKRMNGVCDACWTPIGKEGALTFDCGHIFHNRDCVVPNMWRQGCLLCRVYTIVVNITNRERQRERRTFTLKNVHNLQKSDSNQKYRTPLAMLDDNLYDTRYTLLQLSSSNRLIRSNDAFSKVLASEATNKIDVNVICSRLHVRVVKVVGFGVVAKEAVINLDKSDCIFLADLFKYVDELSENTSVYLAADSSSSSTKVATDLCQYVSLKDHLEERDDRVIAVTAAIEVEFEGSDKMPPSMSYDEYTYGKSEYNPREIFDRLVSAMPDKPKERPENWNYSGWNGVEWSDPVRVKYETVPFHNYLKLKFKKP